MESINNKQAIMADIALFFAAIIWGSSFIAIKSALDYMNPIYLLVLRFSLSSIIMGIMFYKRMIKAKLEDLRAGTIIGAFLFIAFVAQTVGLQYTTVSKSAFITASNVVIVPIIYWIVTREKLDVYGFIASILCFIGLGILSIDGTMKISMGDSLTFFCAIFFALHIIAIGKYSKKHDPIVLTIVQFAVVALLSIMAAILLKIEFKAITGDMVKSVGYLVVANTIIGFGIQNMAQKYTSPSHTAIILSLESVFGSLFAIWLLGEELTVRLVLGSIIILLAIITTETKWAFLKKGYGKKNTVQGEEGPVGEN